MKDFLTSVSEVLNSEDGVAGLGILGILGIILTTYFTKNGYEIELAGIKFRPASKETDSAEAEEPSSEAEAENAGA